MRSPLPGVSGWLGGWPAILAFVLLPLVAAPPAHGQQWTGTAALEASGGYRTNPYLDPLLRTWDPAAANGVAALAPQAQIAVETSRWRVRGGGRAYLQPRSGPPYLLQGSVAGRYRLSPRWSLRATGGGRHYRLSTRRDAWWLLPGVRWRPADRTRLTVRAGLTRRTTRTSLSSPTQTSGLVSASGTTWLTDRLRGTLRAYYTGGRAAATDVGFAGTGATLSAVYWPSASVAVEGFAGLEQVTFDSDGLQAVTVRDRIGRLGGEVRWSPRAPLTLHLRLAGSQAALGGNAGSTTDLHVGAGATLRWSRVLGGEPPTAAPRQLYRQTEGGVRFRLPEGLLPDSGRPHLVGDFNGWSLPGIPMRRDDGQWTAQMDLPTGRYEYRIRIVTDDGRARWLDLPSYVQTTQDAFGGINGVCIVQ